jgi:hypothetical protein
MSGVDCAKNCANVIWRPHGPSFRRVISFGQIAEEQDSYTQKLSRAIDAAYADYRPADPIANICSTKSFSRRLKTWSATALNGATRV